MFIYNMREVNPWTGESRPVLSTLRCCVPSCKSQAVFEFRGVGDGDDCVNYVCDEHKESVEPDAGFLYCVKLDSE